jgi:ubiquinone/menaquinone biosynthesis C-methylase UbiE
MRPSRSFVAVVGAVLALATGAAAQDQPPDINKPFQNPDVDAYIKRFETESREVYAQREAIVRAVGLKPGMAVADLGAGTGLFSRLFADRVGPKGKVYAVDISAPFLKHIEAESKKRGQTQVRTIQGTQDATNLPQGSVDVAFICDVYHHLEQHEKIQESIHQALRPGGRLVVVEFDRRQGVSTDFILKHVRADKAKFLAEIAAAGFEPIKTSEPPPLKENFFAEFRRLDRAKSTP